MAGWLGGWEQWLVGESCGVGMETKRLGGEGGGDGNEFELDGWHGGDGG